MNSRFIYHLGMICCVAMATVRLPADTVETKNGAHLVGQITKIEGGNVYLKTDYAGDLTIKQSEVAGITTDKPVAVRLASGTRLDGQVTESGGSLVVAGRDVALNTDIGKVAALWPAGTEDPELTALRRHWTYEATADVNGKTGNHEQLSTAGSVRADLKTLQDELQFYGNYNRQVTDGQKSADQFKAGIDYASHFAVRESWYVRDEGGFDRIMNIVFYDTAGAGLGYDFIKQPKHTLTVRLGLAYRFDHYKNPTTPDVNSAGLDFGVEHDWEFSDSRLVNRLSIVPAFQNLHDVIATHESFYEIPLHKPQWKLRVGVSNDFNSRPGPGVEWLDTTYFTRLVLDWR